MMIVVLIFAMICLGLLGGVIAGINHSAINCPAKGSLIGLGCALTVILVTGIISLVIPQSQSSDIEYENVQDIPDIPSIRNTH